MIVLAIETATREGSVALARDGVLLTSARGDATRPHAARLPGDALDLLARSGLALHEVSAIAVCLGPGAFTGLRVGIAAAQGLAFATGHPIVGISALDALAVALLEGCPPDAVAGVWIDAARAEVFAARYVAAPETAIGVQALEEPISAPPALVRKAWAVSPPAVSHWIGDGAVRYADVIGAGGGILPAPVLAPLVARLGTAAATAGLAGAPHALRPIYVRPSDAELARDRGERGSDGPA